MNRRARPGATPAQADPGTLDAERARALLARADGRFAPASSWLALFRRYEARVMRSGARPS